MTAAIEPPPIPARRAVPLATEVLAFQGVVRRFGARVALARLDLALAPGGRLGLVGANGAGKSTLLKLAAGVLMASEGRIRVLGHDPLQAPWVRGRIGYLSHEPFFDPHETVSDQVHFAHRMRGGGSPEPEEARRVLGLEAYWVEPFGVLSRGFQRRAELASVLVGSPDLLLLDEPLAGLDQHHRERLTEALEELAPRAAMLTATHLPGDLRSLVPEILPLRDGVAGERTSQATKKVESPPLHPPTPA